MCFRDSVLDHGGAWFIATGDWTPLSDQQLVGYDTVDPACRTFESFATVILFPLSEQLFVNCYMVDSGW